MTVPAVSNTASGETRGRVLIVDDSAVARAVISRMIDATDRFMVAGAVGNACAALDFLSRVTVDFILLDIQMPGIDGLTALPDLLAAGRGARIIVVSSSAGEGAAATVQALALGATDTLAKPGVGGLSGRFADQLLEKLDRLGSNNVVPLAGPMPVRRPHRSAPLQPGGDFDIVAIGASTGGIHALNGVLRGLDASFRLPILITQHLPASFMPYFAAQLALIGSRPCDVATDRLRIRPGRIIVAPGDAHMRCVPLPDGSAAIRLQTTPVPNGCLPSVDPMLGSLSAIYGPRLLAVILSGMGRDGAEGARLVHEEGGTILVQDAASSVIWGMPGAVAALGIAHAEGSPDDLGKLVAARRRP